MKTIDLDFPRECLAQLLIGIDYEQPSNLEGGLQLVADSITELRVFERSKSGTNESTLYEVLSQFKDYTDLDTLLKEVEDIQEILDATDYGILDDENQHMLEDAINDFASSMEAFFDFLASSNNLK